MKPVDHQGCSCGATDCKKCNATEEPIMNRDGCGHKEGSDSECTNTACSPQFQGTTDAEEGVILVKKERGGKCLHTLKGDGFITGDGEKDKHTRQPRVDVPKANDYERDLEGVVLRDSNNKPIPGAVPKFTDLWISGVEGAEHADDLYRVTAPQSEEALYLVGEKGCFMFSRTQRQSFGSNERPKELNCGQILVLPPREQCKDGSWEGRVLDFRDQLETGEVALLQVTQTKDEGTQLKPIKTKNLKGFLRIDADTGAFATSTELEECEVEILTKYINQVLCSEDCDCTEDKDEEPPKPSRILVCNPKDDDGNGGGLGGLTPDQFLTLIQSVTPAPSSGSDDIDLDFTKPLVQIYDPDTGTFVWRNLSDFVPEPQICPQNATTLATSGGPFNINDASLSLTIPPCLNGTLYAIVQGWIMNQDNQEASMEVNGITVVQAGKVASNPAVASGMAYLPVPTSGIFNVVLNGTQSFTPAVGGPIPRLDLHGFICKAT